MPILHAQPKRHPRFSQQAVWQMLRTVEFMQTRRPKFELPARVWINWFECFIDGFLDGQQRRAIQNVVANRKLAAKQIKLGLPREQFMRDRIGCRARKTIPSRCP